MAAHQGDLFKKSDDPDRPVADVELFDDQAASRGEHAVHLAQGLGLIGHMMEGIDHQHPFETAVGERHPLRG